MWAKQSTAATLIVGPILDSTGAEFTTAVIGDLSISKNGGTLTALASAATLTHIANGQYTLVTTTGNLDTLGRAQITCNKSTYQMPAMNLMVVPANVFDAMILGTDALDVSTIQFAGQTITAAAGVTIPASIASPTNITAATGIVLSAVTHTGAVIPTVTTVTNGLDAAGVRTAIGLTVANLDTQLADLPTVAEFEARSIPAADYFVVGDYTAPPSASTISSQVASDLATAHGVGAWTTATGFSTLSQADIRTAVGLTTANLDTQIGNIQSDTNDIQTRLPAALESGRIAAALDSAARVKLDATQPDYAPATAAALATESGKITNIENASGYVLAVLAGACADPQTASETYAITVFGSTFTVDMAGQASTGTRTAPTLTKT